MKDEILRAIQELTADATVEDAMERPYLLEKVERGIAQADNRQTVSQDEARRRMAGSSAYVREQVLGRERAREDVLVVGEARHGVERGAVGRQAVGQRIVADQVAAVRQRRGVF